MAANGAEPVVLVIDDDPDIAHTIRDVLQGLGYPVELALGGEAALEVAGRHRVGLVLLDWRLPTEPAGGSLVRRLRDVVGVGVPIVVISADPTSLAEARDANVADYLPKPFDIGDLQYLVDERYQS